MEQAAGGGVHSRKKDPRGPVITQRPYLTSRRPMYRYDAYDHAMLEDRVAQFRSQTDRYLAGALRDEEFLPLRLQNGLYIQRHAPMLRVAVPYGLLSSTQLRMLAQIARRYDKGYAHFSTRQNLQFNWPELARVPDILADLASVEMHAIQTSGNCIRNITTDQFAGVAADEEVDPRPYCEILRQWSTFHPEFAYLPRKFKIAVNGARADRAAVQVHDIGIYLKRGTDGNVLASVLVGGGLGRTPAIGVCIRENLPMADLLTYLDAILRVYNRFGDRQNKYKARIKILVKAWGAEKFAAEVEKEWVHMKGNQATLTDDELARVAAFFTDPEYADLPDNCPALEARIAGDRPFAAWYKRNTHPHKRAGYRSVTLSIKETGEAPGDVTDRQMDAIADLADRYSFGEARVSHEQNMILADVRIDELEGLYEAAKQHRFVTPNIGLLTNIICCPGGDFCSLANAKSIPVAESIQRRFEDLDYLFDIGDLDLNISGCMNACGHHHVGHIGVLGVDKKGEEWYQIKLGGNQGLDASLGDILGPSFSRAQVTDVIENIVQLYLERRESPEERFIDAYRRIGIEPFKERVYAQNH